MSSIQPFSSRFSDLHPAGSPCRRQCDARRQLSHRDHGLMLLFGETPGNHHFSLSAPSPSRTQRDLTLHVRGERSEEPPRGFGSFCRPWFCHLSSSILTPLQRCSGTHRFTRSETATLLLQRSRRASDRVLGVKCKLNSLTIAQQIAVAVSSQQDDEWRARLLSQLRIKTDIVQLTPT